MSTVVNCGTERVYVEPDLWQLWLLTTFLKHNKPGRPSRSSSNHSSQINTCSTLTARQSRLSKFPWCRVPARSPRRVSQWGFFAWLEFSCFPVLRLTADPLHNFSRTHCLRAKVRGTPRKAGTVLGSLVLSPTLPQGAPQKSPRACFYGDWLLNSQGHLVIFHWK